MLLPALLLPVLLSATAPVVPEPVPSVPLAPPSVGTDGAVDPSSDAVALALALVRWVTELAFPQLVFCLPSSPPAQDVTTIMTMDAAVEYPRNDRLFMR